MKNLYSAVQGTHYRAVLFDFDGTLADSAHCGVLATHKTFEAFGLRIPPNDEIVSYMGIPIEDSFPLLDARLSDHRLLDDVIASFRSEYRVLSDQHIRLFPGVVDLLEMLKAARTPLAIVTSKHGPVAQRNLLMLGIADFFQAVVGPEMVAKPKPAPDIANYALNLLGVKASNDILVVGDTSFDIVMGRSAAVHTCAVGWGAHSPEQLAKAGPTHQVANVDELRSLLLHGSSPISLNLEPQS